jgi:hypothetical protein
MTTASLLIGTGLFWFGFVVGWLANRRMSR